MAKQNWSGFLAVAALTIFGPVGEKLVTIGALVSIIGVLNGWLLVTGRLPFAAARDGYGPRFLARIHPRFGTPVTSLIVSSILSGALALLYFNQTLLKAYNFIALFATDTALFAIAVACVAHFVLLRREPEQFTRAQRVRGPIVAFIGILALGFMVYGSGLVVIGYTVLAMLVPLLYWYVAKPESRTN